MSVQTRFICLSILLIPILLKGASDAVGQSYWHDIPRAIRYTPDGEDFVIANGDKRFNRALYGYPSSYRVEAGDLPEFAFYLPGMGGNLTLALHNNGEEKWLIEADHIEARYRSGKMVYIIHDPLLGEGSLSLEVLPVREAEGVIFKAIFDNVATSVELICVFGGVSGEKFSRSGDMGADPESVFYLTEKNADRNIIQLGNDNTFRLQYGAESSNRPYVRGTFPTDAALRIADAKDLSSVASLLKSQAANEPLLVSRIPSGSKEIYWSIYQPGFKQISHHDLPVAFKRADEQRVQLAERVTVKTPDPYINTIGGPLAIAANAIFDEEVSAYVHGAVAWRMPLPGWRGAYVADGLGWHDRARRHFSGYLKSQYEEPEGSRNDPDPEKNWGRQIEKAGKSIYNKGYISRRPGPPSAPHHYDMNQVFFDQLIRHFQWTGDTVYLKEVYPAMLSHLAWEKRNFDPDDDGLYNAFASIWASDGLQYNGGGVAHSSAYNYYAHKKTAELGKILGEDVGPLEKEAEKIKRAMNYQLWLPQQGSYGEYIDLLGEQKVHPKSGVWSVYHVLDSEVADPFQAYLMTKYVDREIPHIPLVAEGLPEGFQTISTTNWMPYTWSVNNVALAEVLHTSLAYWQAGNTEKAFTLWKSALLESMYLGGSPGNFQQLSFLDAMRGELYRDFADPIGMASRTLIEGLFGIQPDLMNGSLLIQPGFPVDWEHASLTIPDISFDYASEGATENYQIINKFGLDLSTTLILPAKYDEVKNITYNGLTVSFNYLEDAIGKPHIQISFPLQSDGILNILWGGEPFRTPEKQFSKIPGDDIFIGFEDFEVIDFKDPQGILNNVQIENGKLSGTIEEELGYKTLFVKIQKINTSWWQPLEVLIRSPFIVTSSIDSEQEEFTLNIENNTAKEAILHVNVNDGTSKPISIPSANKKSITWEDYPNFYPGTNTINLISEDKIIQTAHFENWDIPLNGNLDLIDLGPYFNDRVTQVFENEYLSPRSHYPTLQLPIQGLGDWASFGAYMKIDDGGLRELAGENRGVIILPNGINLKVSQEEEKNIVFTSYFDNYPNVQKIPLAESAKHAYLLMAGTTNHMQSRFENGKIIVNYKDGSFDELLLTNPDNWWPIEQDYFIDGYAFDTDRERPYRIHLKTGKISNEAHDAYVSIDHFTKYAIEGGAATVLDIPLNPDKELDSLTLETTAVDVIIGIMAITLLR